MATALTLRDRFGRVHDDLRLSVTDRCNLRCSYCMPEEPEWFPRREVLSFEEIARFVRIAAGCGVRKLRLTGGEPLVRRDLPLLIAMLDGQEGIEDLSLTTNGLLLGGAAADLRAGGLQRVNVSLDSLDRERYERMTRRDALDRVLDGLAVASEVGLDPIKINTVVLKGENEDEVEALVGRAREHGWELRFIEFMPLENGGRWIPDRVVSGRELRERIARSWPMHPDGGSDPHAPATRWRFDDGRGSVGFIDSVSAPFCGSCGRLRLTADGKIRVCLYDDRETDVKAALRSGADDAAIRERLVQAVLGKGPGGALEIRRRGAALPLARTMHQIGG